MTRPLTSVAVMTWPSVALGKMIVLPNWSVVVIWPLPPDPPLPPLPALPPFPPLPDPPFPELPDPEPPGTPSGTKEVAGRPRELVAVTAIAGTVVSPTRVWPCALVEVTGTTEVLVARTVWAPPLGPGTITGMPPWPPLPEPPDPPPPTLPPLPPLPPLPTAEDEGVGACDEGGATEGMLELPAEGVKPVPAVAEEADEAAGNAEYDDGDPIREDASEVLEESDEKLAAPAKDVAGTGTGRPPPPSLPEDVVVPADVGSTGSVLGSGT